MKTPSIEPSPQPVRKWLELIEDSLDDVIDESAYPHPLLRRVISAIEVDGLSSRDRYIYKEEAEWEDSKTESFNEGVKRGRKEARKEARDEGHKEGLRVGVLSMCELLGIELTEARRVYIDELDAEQLELLIAALKRDKRWPDMN